MEDNTQPINSDRAKEILLECYRNGRDGSFAEFLLRQIQDPIQPRDPETQRRRFHPVLITVLLFAGIGLAVFAYFTFHK